MKIEILGTGCPKCEKLMKNAKNAVEEARVSADIVKVEDIDKILSHGIMMTPGLVIDGKVKCSGRIATVDEIIGFIKQD